MIAEKCAVCDGESIGIHFGVPCCESCRTFFTRHKKKDSVGYCSRGGNCKITEQQCTPCRFRKSLKAGMEKKNETELLKILPGHAIVMKILAAHNEICEYTREKIKKLVMSDYPWTPDQNTDLTTNRVYAWKAYCIQFERDIKSIIKFIKRLQDNLPMNDRLELIKKHLFQMYFVRIIRALSRNGLLFSDGRLISLDFFIVLFGEQLAEEMIKLSEQALHFFKLDDDDLAMLLVMSYYPRIPGNELTVHEVGDEEALMKLSRESRCNFSQWCEDRMKPGTFLHILIMLKKLEQLDNMYKTDVIGFLKSNAKHFDPKTIFAEIYLM
ncbi:unnamed protein product [Caenorhabditis brenneri]